MKLNRDKKQKRSQERTWIIWLNFAKHKKREHCLATNNILAFTELRKVDDGDVIKIASVKETI